MPRSDPRDEATLPAPPPRTPRAWWLVPLALAAVLSLARGAHNAISADWGSTDLHAYWLAGHFLRANRDPYAAFLYARRPAVPVRYLDGTIETEDVVQPDLGNLPANTAPMTLILAPLAWWSWPWAKAIWASLNLALALAIPWLALGLLPTRPPPWARWTTALAFWAFVATRVAIGTGQTTLLALAAMLGALWLAWSPSRGLHAPGAERGGSIGWHVVGSGLLFGLAISKYSLAFPAVLLLAWRRRWRILAIAAAAQLLAYGFMAWLPGGGWKETLNAYLILLQMHLPQDGIHVASVLGGGAVTGLVTGIAISVMTFGPLVWWSRGGRRTGLARGGVGPGPGSGSSAVLQGLTGVAAVDAGVLAVLCLWSLLVVYHRVYDAVVVVMLLALAMGILSVPRAWRIARVERAILAGVLGVVIAVLVLAGEGLVGSVLPGGGAVGSEAVARGAATVALLGGWILSLWLCARAVRSVGE